MTDDLMDAPGTLVVDSMAGVFEVQMTASLVGIVGAAIADLPWVKGTSNRAWSEEEAAKHPRDEKGLFAPKPHPDASGSVIDDTLEYAPEDVLLNPDYMPKDQTHEYAVDQTGIEYHVWRSGKNKTVWREQWPYTYEVRHPIEEWDPTTHLWKVCNPELWKAADRLQELFPKTAIVVHEWDLIAQEVYRVGDTEIKSLLRGFEDVVPGWPALTGVWTGKGRDPWMIDKIEIGPISKSGRFGEAVAKNWRETSESILRISIDKFNPEGAATLAKDGANGWHPYNCNDWASVARHELGHFVHYMDSAVVAKWIGREFGKPSENGVWYQETDDPRRPHIVDPRKFPSKYAMKDAWELWAESFARATGSHYALDPKTGYTPDILPLIKAMQAGEAAFGDIPDTPA